MRPGSFRAIGLVGRALYFGGIAKALERTHINNAKFQQNRLK